MRLDIDLETRDGDRLSPLSVTELGDGLFRLENSGGSLYSGLAPDQELFPVFDGLRRGQNES